MDVVGDEPTNGRTTSASEDEEGPDLEELIVQSLGDDEVSPPSPPAIDDEEDDEGDDESSSEVEELHIAPGLPENTGAPRTWVVDEEIQSEVVELGATTLNNGVNDSPVRTVGDEPDDEIHVIPTQPAAGVGTPYGGESGKLGEAMKRPKVMRSEDIAPEVEELEVDEADEEPSEPRAPELTMQVVDPGLIAHIGDAMDAIGESVESVVLIHLKIAYQDTAPIVPTEAARVLVAQSTKECVRYDDYVARVGENSFVIVARLRPGSPEPAFIEKRLMKAARKATGWADDGPTFRTEHLVVEPDGIDDPEDVLLTLLHG